MRGCDRDLKREKSENDFNSRKIISKDFKWMKIVHCQNGKIRNIFYFFGWAKKWSMEIVFLTRKRKEGESWTYNLNYTKNVIENSEVKSIRSWTVEIRWRGQSQPRCRYEFSWENFKPSEWSVWLASCGMLVM